MYGPRGGLAARAVVVAASSSSSGQSLLLAVHQVELLSSSPRSSRLCSQYLNMVRLHGECLRIPWHTPARLWSCGWAHRPGPSTSGDYFGARRSRVHSRSLRRMYSETNRRTELRRLKMKLPSG